MYSRDSLFRKSFDFFFIFLSMDQFFDFVLRFASAKRHKFSLRKLQK